MDVSQRGEFGLIRQLDQILSARAGTKLGIGDDGAVLESLAHPVVTCDALVENVHFRRDWTSAFALGVKAMAVNLSDLAAMGAAPVAALVTLALPPNCQLEWVEGLYSGMESLAQKYGFTVAGGDTTRAPLAMIALTLIGDLMPQARGQAVLRGGARVGDAVCVTGTLGDSAAGLALLQHSRREVLAAPIIWCGAISNQRRDWTRCAAFFGRRARRGSRGVGLERRLGGRRRAHGARFGRGASNRGRAVADFRAVPRVGRASWACRRSTGRWRAARITSCACAWRPLPSRGCARRPKLN